MALQPPVNPAPYLRLAESLAALAALVAALECLHQRHLFRPGFASARSTSPALTAALRSLAPLHRAPNILILLTLQAITAATILIHPTAPALLLLTLTTYLLHLRDHDASTGAERFLLQFLPACALAALVDTPTARTLALLFLTAQSAIVYGTSGLLKLRHPGWRNGSAILHILAGSQDGNRHLYSFLLPRPRLATLAGLAVCAEVLLAFAAFTPPELCLTLLIGGIIMHLIIARIMGLNTYLLAFPAAYPAIFFTSRLIYAHLQIFSK